MFSRNIKVSCCSAKWLFRRLKLVLKSPFLCTLDIKVDDSQGDHDDDDSNDGVVVDYDDMEGEDITKDKGLRHQHECQELPVQT